MKSHKVRQNGLKSHLSTGFEGKMTPKQEREAFQQFREHGDFENDVRVRQIARELSDLTGIKVYDGKMFRAQVAMFLYAARSIGYELVPEASWKRLNGSPEAVSGRQQQT